MISNKHFKLKMKGRCFHSRKSCVGKDLQGAEEAMTAMKRLARRLNSTDCVKKETNHRPGLGLIGDCTRQAKCVTLSEPHPYPRAAAAPQMVFYHMTSSSFDWVIAYWTRIGHLLVS